MIGLFVSIMIYFTLFISKLNFILVPALSNTFSTSLSIYFSRFLTRTP